MKKIRFYYFVVILAEIIFIFFLLTKGADRVVLIIDEIFEGKRSVSAIFMVGEVINSVKLFNAHLGGAENYFWKLTMIIKLLIIVALTGLFLFHITHHNIKDNTVGLYFLVFFKLLIIYMFFLVGTATVLQNIAKDTVWEFGNLFSVSAAKVAFLKNKLTVAIVLGLCIFDLVMYHTERSK